jgi:hypothetical protein
VVISTMDRSDDGAAGITNTPPPDPFTLTTERVGPQAQKWLEKASGPVLHGNATEQACARTFAAGRPNPQLELVQPVTVDGRRATMIGLRGASSRDIQVFVVTGCSDSGGVASPFYDTTVTLRNR